MTAALETTDLRKSFGGIAATAGVRLRLEPGARHALIGPNGAGKTTLINLLTGVLRPDAGRIALDGRDVTGLAADRRVRLGMVRTFQINQLFADMTPVETIRLAVTQRLGRGTDWWRARADGTAVADGMAEVIERFGLADVLDVPTSSLAYGKQRLLEIAIAFACQPRVLLLDEPAAGVPEDERHEILAAVAALPREVSVLLIEHDMDLVFSFAERISVLVNGALLTEGTPDAIAADARVRAVYLGEGGHG
ncbi:MAG: ABC transporter ATP-binding protein [Hyphomicrobiaceae bacterium]